MPRFVDLPLHTPRLVLRPLADGDAPALFAIFSDPAVMRYWATPPWTAFEQAIERIRRDQEYFADGSALRLALQPVGGGDIVGTVSLFAFEEQSGRAEIGYILARSCWGMGLMHEALDAAIQYAFSTLGVRRLEADIDPRNERSTRRLERLGFVREGLLHERWVVAGEVSDSALYGLLARHWLARRSGVGVGATPAAE